MPFDKEGSWRPPSLDSVRSSIQKSSVRSVPVTHELKAQVDQAISQLSSKGGASDILEANQRLYRTFEKVAQSPRGLVDIILPVYNSIHLTKRCVRSVLERTEWPFHLYIVDDASDGKTHRDLAAMAESNPHITLITNRKNRGFAATVNRGMKAGNGEYFCWLNSDVIVTKLWLTKMVLALISSTQNQLVCPVTNNTAIVEVPMYPGASYLQMNRVLEMFALRRYPEIMPTGFCMMGRRTLLDKVGYLDCAYKSYGEDSDLWWRTIRHAENGRYARYRAVLADDCYVFHQRSGSFSALGEEAHQGLRKRASGRFNQLWPEWVEWKKQYSVEKALGPLRAPVSANLLRSPEDRYRICWVVMSAKMCGGMKYIADLVNEINERGGNAKVAVVKRRPEDKEQCLPELTTAPVFFESMEHIIQDFRNRVFPRGTIVAAVPELFPAVTAIEALSEGNLRAVSHMQSYEPAITSDERTRNAALQLYKVTPKHVISSSVWVTEEVQSQHQIEPFMTVYPGVDRELFYPRGREKGDDRPTVMIPMSQGMECKGFDRGLALISELERLAEESDLEIRILVYACDVLPTISDAICLGVVDQTRLAHLLGTEVDAFIDPSYVHSYGMPALEALASGVKVFSWDNRGVRQYGDRSLVETFEPNEEPTNIATAIIDYLDSDKPRLFQNEWGAIDHYLSQYHDRRKSVAAFLAGMEQYLRLRFVPRRIVFVVPHLRKFGGPTTMLALANKLADLGHTVSITTVYADVKDEVVQRTSLPVRVDGKLDPCDVIITNSDNPKNDDIAKLKGVKKIMLKLSHNPRFKELEERGLQKDWDAIVTTTEWLADACRNPTEGWDYKPQEAINIGWWHYSFEELSCPPDRRVYHPEGKIRIGTLIHSHPSKGTQSAIRAIGEIVKRYGPQVQTLGIGEVPRSALTCDLPSFQYLESPGRDLLARALRSVDIWVGASTTEGLGRMGLEAMSAGCAVVLSDTGAEYARDGENCFTFPVGDYSFAAAKLVDLIDNPDIAKSIRENGYRTAERMADAEPCVQALQDVIDKVFRS